MRQTVYDDLASLYENPMEVPCELKVGQSWVSLAGERPEGMCPAAWDSLSPFARSLSRAEGNFYDGWMKNPLSALVSCNDGCRPMSFYLEAIEDE